MYELIETFVFVTPNSKNIIATLRIVTTEKSELAFLLILYFHDITQIRTTTCIVHFLHKTLLATQLSLCLFIFQTTQNKFMIFGTHTWQVACKKHKKQTEVNSVMTPLLSTRTLGWSFTVHSLAYNIDT